jgi:hypothetical protein
MVALGLQNSVEDVRRAATQSDEYSFRKHMFLRRTFVTIYLTDSGKAVDCHKHYIEACGHSEHAWFIETLQKPDGLANITSGPKNSKPQPKKPKAKSKRSEALSAMLRSPSSRGGNRQAAHAEPAGGVVLAMPDKERPIEPSMEASEMESDNVDSTRCVARTFFGGLGRQCTRKHSKGSDYCEGHNAMEKRKHGRMDEDPPACMPKAKKLPRAAATSQATAVMPSFSSGSAASSSNDGPSGARLPMAPPLASTKISQISTTNTGQPRSGTPSWTNPLASGGPALKRNRISPLQTSSQSFPATATNDGTSKKDNAPTLQGWRELGSGMDLTMKLMLGGLLQTMAEYEEDMDKGNKLSLETDALASRIRRERMQTVQTRLKKMNRQRQPTPALGDCQFIAVARSLGFPDDSHGELRKEVCDFLALHREDFQDSLVTASDGVFDRYLNKMRRLGSWGDHVTLAAMARMFKVTFTIVNDESSYPKFHE